MAMVPTATKFQSAPSQREGDVLVVPGDHGGAISIRALPEGGRPVAVEGGGVWVVFQSAPSQREGDVVPGPLEQVPQISIRALPEGGRPEVARAHSASPSISIRALPEGGRPAPDILAMPVSVISIRALPEGGRQGSSTSRSRISDFNPRPPRGRATAQRGP